MRWLRQYVRTLRRKQLKTWSHRNNAMWNFVVYRLEFELAKTFMPILLGVFVVELWGWNPVTTSIFYFAGAVSATWFLLVFWMIVSVSTRMADKEYMLITRNSRSKEYRK